MKLSGPQLERLAKLIGDRANFDAMDRIVYEATGTGDRRINEFAERGDPTHDVARGALIDAAKFGTEHDLLVLVALAFPDDTKLRAAIGEACPEAFAQSPGTEARVQAVMAAIASARGGAASPAVRDPILERHGPLRSIASTLRRLNACKRLHDSLHQIQIQQYGHFEDAIDLIAGNALKADALRTYQEALLASHASASLAVHEMPEDAQAPEHSWLQQLQQASSRYQSAADARDASAARIAIQVFRQILVSEPPRLDKEMYSSVRMLELAELLVTLTEIAAKMPETGPTLNEGMKALRDLRRGLAARIVEHRLWQQADDALWKLDETLDQSPESAIEAFVKGWFPVKVAVRRLAEEAPEASWSRDLRLHVSAIDQELTNLEKRTASNAATDRERLGALYERFQQAARLQFFCLDVRLKADCGALVLVGSPLEDLLKEVERV